MAWWSTKTFQPRSARVSWNTANSSLKRVQSAHGDLSLLEEKASTPLVPVVVEVDATYCSCLVSLFKPQAPKPAAVVPPHVCQLVDIV